MTIGRLTRLAAFIRNQANLTDKHPHQPGPGEVKLNNAEALDVADALDLLVQRQLDQRQRVHMNCPTCKCCELIEEGGES